MTRARPGSYARELLGAIDAVYLVDTPKRYEQIASLFPGVEALAPRMSGWSGCLAMLRVGEWSSRIRDRSIVVWTPDAPKPATLRQMRAVGRAAVQAGALRAYGQIHVSPPRRIALAPEGT